MTRRNETSPDFYWSLGNSRRQVFGENRVLPAVCRKFCGPPDTEIHSVGIGRIPNSNCLCRTTNYLATDELIAVIEVVSRPRWCRSCG